MSEKIKLEDFFSSEEKIDTKKIIDDLLKNFSPKEKTVIKRRFGLDRAKRQTLEKVGQAHNLTRERIRQIEKTILDKILLDEIKEDLAQLRELVILLLEEHGGVAEKDHLFRVLDKVSDLSLNFQDEEKKKKIKENHFDFLLSRIFRDDLEEIKREDKLKDAFKLKSQTLEHVEELSRELTREIKKLKIVLETKELLEMITKLESFKKHEEKLKNPVRIRLNHLFEEEMPLEEKQVLEDYRGLYSILKLLREIERNKFGHWGHASWNEISPKTVNDKIYLVLKNYNKPLHFTEIADLINQTNFDHKTTNPATVHNELILDDKYVLIGRGMYGLKEWGLKEGTVVQVIKDILASSSQALSREEIIDKVLKNRLVKKSTMNLALSNRKEFQRVGDKYVLAEK